MKKVLLLFTLFLSINANAQDIIVKKDGTTILSKIVEVGTSEVKYKKYKNQKGPSYIIKITDILSINYQNGEKEDFANSNYNEHQDKSTPTLIKQQAANNNEEIISRYNRDYLPNEKLRKKGGATNHYMLVFWASPTSIMSNKDIEVTLVRHEYLYPEASGIGIWQHVNYTVSILNKTNKTIYIDKGNCFRVENDGTSYCYYENPDQISISHGRSSSVSVGGAGVITGSVIGGLSVGGGKSNSVSTTYSQQRVISIAPHGRKNLTEEKIVNINNSGNRRQLVEKAETFDFDFMKSSGLEWGFGGRCTVEFENNNKSQFKLDKQIVEKGKVLTYDETNTPYVREYILTYSTDEKFTSYSTLSQKWYLREIIGAEKYYKSSTMSECLKINTANHLEGTNEYTIEGYYNAEKD